MDNRIGAHVALARLVEADDGRSWFADANLAYDKVLGPLSQSTVIDAHITHALNNTIRFSIFAHLV